MQQKSAALKPTPTCPQWGIAQLAAHFEITTRALRFYEDKGLISPARVSGHRAYSETDKLRLEKILRGKRIGFSLEDIKTVMEVTDGEITDIEELKSRKAGFETVIKRLRTRRADIDIITKDMQGLCMFIDDYLESAPISGVFEFADAYDAMFRAHLDEDYLPL